MRAFSTIFKEAAKRKGGADALERLLSNPLSPKEIKAISADRWLSAMTMCVFQAGFNWRAIENKWSRFEEVFENFDVVHCSMMNEEDLDRLLVTPGIVANGAKIRAVGDNARYLRELEQEHASVGAYFVGWRISDYTDNLRVLQKKSARLGGKTGQVFLRRMGVDTLVFSPDVLKALDREGIVDKMPTSAKDYSALQTAIDGWHGESGRPLTQMSQILAFSVE